MFLIDDFLVFVNSLKKGCCFFMILRFGSRSFFKNFFRGRRAQFAMEYLLVIAFSVVIILPVINYLYQEYDANRSEVYLDQMHQFSNELVFQAEKIYYQGFPSKTIVSAYFPPGIKSIIINSSANFIEVLFDNDFNPPIVISRVPISGSLKTFSGPHNVLLEVVDAGPAGPEGDYVRISDI